MLNIGAPQVARTMSFDTGRSSPSGTPFTAQHACEICRQVPCLYILSGANDLQYKACGELFIGGNQRLFLPNQESRALVRCKKAEFHVYPLYCDAYALDEIS